MAEATYFITYTGAGVTELKGAGVFAHGTGAYVSEEAARAALASGGSWAVTEPGGKQVGSLPSAPAPKPAPAAPKHEEKKAAEEKKPEKAGAAEHKVEEKKEPAAAGKP